MRRHIQLVLGLFAAISCASCSGGSSSPTAPTTASAPTVSGSYSGTVVFTFPELRTSVTCPANTTVTQSGRTVSIAPIVTSGQCAGMSIPFGQTTIDNTGAIEGGSSTGSYTDPSCGTYSYSASGGFFGRELRVSLSATSRTCWNLNATISLSR